MSQVCLALAAFLLLHSVPAIPTLRGRLTDTLGLRGYLLSYSATSVALLIWVLHAAWSTEYVEIWQPDPRNALANLVLSPLGLFMVTAGLISPNPASVSFSPGTTPGAITTITRHPVLWGFLLWSFGHVLANGDARSLLVFGGLGVFSIIGIFVVEKRAQFRLGGEWPLIAQSTSVFPLIALFSGRAKLRLDGHLVAALALTLLVTIWLLTGGHAALFGVDPILALDI
ncbi:NnrU family protein [Agrobacterium vitis]|uniref:NnrU family protein n=1 Tax=Agrobacterium vitis TaxID=373 RepID=UPI0008DC16F4|nr:NnrU family protein [Agrobacterium vitis]MUO85295.1 NnrU family protein [Agrobacterium vitis]